MLSARFDRGRKKKKKKKYMNEERKHDWRTLNLWFAVQVPSLEGKEQSLVSKEGDRGATHACSLNHTNISEQWPCWRNDPPALAPHRSTFSKIMNR